MPVSEFSVLRQCGWTGSSQVRSVALHCSHTKSCSPYCKLDKQRSASSASLLRGLQLQCMVHVPCTLSSTCPEFSSAKTGWHSMRKCDQIILNYLSRLNLS